MWIVVEYFDQKNDVLGAWGVPDCWVDKSEMLLYYPKNWLTLRKIECDPQPSWKNLPIKRILFSKIGNNLLNFSFSYRILIIKLLFILFD